MSLCSNLVEGRFSAAVPAGARSRLIRELLQKYLENQSQGEL